MRGLKERLRRLEERGEAEHDMTTDPRRGATTARIAGALCHALLAPARYLVKGGGSVGRQMPRYEKGRDELHATR